MQQQDAFVVDLVEAPTREVTVVDVIVGSLGVAGLMTLAAVVLGALLGWFLIIRSRRHGIEDPDGPPSISTSTSPTR